MYFILFLFLSTLRFFYISTLDKKIIKNIFITNHIFNLHKKYRNTFNKYYCKYIIRTIATPIIWIYLIFQPILVINQVFKYCKTENDFYEIWYFFIIHPVAIPKYQLCFYNGYIIEDFNINTYNLYGFFDKTVWEVIFLLNKVSTPKTYGRITNGTIITCNSNNRNKITNCIIKPLHEYQGRGIELYDNNKDYSKYIDNYIIQTRLQFDNYVNHSVHLRCITCYKNDELSVYQLQLFVYRSSTCLTSNPGVIHEINIETNLMRPLNTNNWIDTKIDAKHYETCIQNSKKIHQYFIDKNIPLLSIAFDIIISNDICYFLEGNIFHGVVFPYDKFFIKNAKKYLESIF